MKTEVPVRSSILSTADSLTEDERKLLNEERANRSLDRLLEYAKDNRSFAVSLCKKTTDIFGSDDELSSVIGKRLRVERTGKNKGRHKEWTDTRYRFLLIHYNVLYKSVPAKLKRLDVLNMLADMEKLNGANRARQIERRITEARKRFSAEDLE